MAKTISYGNNKLDYKDFIANLASNVDSYVNSHPEWSEAQKNLFKEQYGKLKNAMQESLDNDTDRFSIDEFGTITDKYGEFKDATDEDNLIDKHGNLVTDTSALSAKKKAKLTAFKAPQLLANYAHSIASATVKQMADQKKSIPGFADYWQKQHDPEHNLTDQNFWTSLDEKGKYTNRIAQTLEDLNKYTSDYNLSEEQLQNLEKYKELLTSDTVGTDQWKKDLRMQAAKLGFGKWNDQFFGLVSPKPVQQENTVNPDDTQWLLDNVAIDEDRANWQKYPGSRDAILNKLKNIYHLGEKKVEDDANALEKQLIDDANKKKWDDYLKANPWYFDATKRKYTNDQIFGIGQVNNRKDWHLEEGSNLYSALKNLNTWLGKFKTHNDLLDKNIVELTNQYGQKYNLKNYGELLAYAKPLLDKMSEAQGTQWWANNFDKVQDKQGNEIFKVKNSKTPSGEYLYLMFKNGKLYTYYSKPYQDLYREVIKAQLGVKLISKEQADKQAYLENLPNRAKANKVTVNQQKNLDRTDFTTSEYARMAGVVSDIGSVITALASPASGGMGSIASIGLGLGSTAANAYADYTDGTMSNWDATKNLFTNVGLDLLGSVTGGTAKYGKIVKTVAKFAPRLLAAYGTLGTVENMPQIIASTKKFINNPSEINVQDLQNITQGIGLVTGLSSATARKVKQNNSTVVGTRVGVKMRNKNTGEVKTFVFKGDEAKTIRNAKDNAGIQGIINKHPELKGYSLEQVNKVGMFPHLRKLRDENKHWQSPLTYNSAKTQIYDIYTNDRGKTLYSTKEGIRGWLQPYGNNTEHVKVGQLNRQKTSSAPSNSSGNSSTNTSNPNSVDFSKAQAEAQVNLAPGSAYQKLRDTIKRTRSIIASDLAAGREISAAAYRNALKQDIEELRSMTPEYNKLRAMTQTSPIGKSIKDVENGQTILRNWQDIVKKYNLKYKEGGVIKARKGTKTDWRLGLTPYDVNKYKAVLDTSKLYSVINGVLGDAIISKEKGQGSGRYKTAKGYTREQVKAIQNQPQYKAQTASFIDENGNFTPEGLKFAKLSDAKLPKDSEARFFDSDGIERTSWTANNNDPYGRAPQKFTNRKDYMNYTRNDDLLGARHNVFINKGKRYYYLDDNKQRVYVDPNVISKYKLADKTTQEWDPNTFTNWTDQEIVGLAPEKSHMTDLGDNRNTEEPKQKFNLKNISPTLLYGIPRAIAADRINRKITNLSKTSPLLLEPMSMHRNVYSDYNAETTGYNNWAQLRNLASQPVSSDANLNTAARLEANLKGQQMYQQAKAQSDQIARQSAEASWEQEKANKQNAWQIANTNKESVHTNNEDNRKREAAYYTQKYQIWDTLAQELQKDALTNYQINKARADKFAQEHIKNYVKQRIQNPTVYSRYGLSKADVDLWADIANGFKSTTDLTDAEKQSFMRVSQAASNLENDSIMDYFNIPKSKYYIQYNTPTFRPNINFEKRIAKKGGKLDIEFLKAAAKDADRFYKTTKDFADRTERAIARLQGSKKKKRSK